MKQYHINTFLRFEQVRVKFHFWCVMTQEDQRESWFLKVSMQSFLMYPWITAKVCLSGERMKLQRYCLRRPSMERYRGVCEIQRHAVKTRKVKCIALITVYSHISTLIDESFLKQNWHFTLHSTIPLTRVTAAVTALHQRSTLVLYKRVKSYQRETGWHT